MSHGYIDFWIFSDWKSRHFIVLYWLSLYNWLGAWAPASHPQPSTPPHTLKGVLDPYWYFSSVSQGCLSLRDAGRIKWDYIKLGVWPLESVVETVDPSCSLTLCRTEPWSHLWCIGGGGLPSGTFLLSMYWPLCFPWPAVESWTTKQPRQNLQAFFFFCCPLPAPPPATDPVGVWMAPALRKFSLSPDPLLQVLQHIWCSCENWIFMSGPALWGNEASFNLFTLSFNKHRAPTVCPALGMWWWINQSRCHILLRKIDANVV